MPDQNQPQWGASPQGPSEQPQRRRSWGMRHKILTALIAIIGLIIVIAIASSGGGGDGGSPTTTTPPEQNRQEEPQKGKDPGIGDQVRDGKFEFIVTKVQPGVRQIGDQFGKKAQGQFILVHVTVTNISNESQTFNGSDQKMFDAKEREFSADTEAAIYLDESESFLNEINPGNTVKGIVVFDVPKDVKPVKLELHDSLFSGGVTVNVERS